MKIDLKKIENIRSILNPDARYYDKRNDGYHETERNIMADVKNNVFIVETITRKFYEIPSDDIDDLSFITGYQNKEENK